MSLTLRGIRVDLASRIECTDQRGFSHPQPNNLPNLKASFAHQRARSRAVTLSQAYFASCAELNPYTLALRRSLQSMRTAIPTAKIRGNAQSSTIAMCVAWRVCNEPRGSSHRYDEEIKTEAEEANQHFYVSRTKPCPKCHQVRHFLPMLLI